MQRIYGWSAPPQMANELDNTLQLLDAGHQAAEYYKMLRDYGDDGGMFARRFSWGRDVGVTFDELE